MSKPPSAADYNYGEDAGRGVGYVPPELDWRRADLYPKHGSLTPQQWAWELIRRDFFYWEAWEKRYNIEAVQIQFGLARLYDPAKSAAELGDTLRFIPWQPQIIDGARPRVVKVWPMETAIIINKALPPAPQLVQAAKLLKQGTPRIRDDKFPIYLRLLDADRASAKPAEIAKVLFPRAERMPPDGASRSNWRRRSICATTRPIGRWRPCRRAASAAPKAGQIKPRLYLTPRGQIKRPFYMDLYAPGRWAQSRCLSKLRHSWIP
jgi:hypothetical protein